MKVALVHDYLKEYGGAERVLEALHKIFPKAPVYTAYFDPNGLGPHAKRFQAWDIRTSWLQKVPFAGLLLSPFRIFAPMIFESFDMSGYDLVISSSSAVYFAKSVITKPETFHISYIHTPPRFLYGYTTSFNYKKNPVIRVLAEIANHFLRIWDFEVSQRPDILVANSKNIQDRIKKFYRRDSVVIYPPVSLPVIPSPVTKYGVNSARNLKKEYFLTVGRLVRGKGVDIIVEVCTKLNLPLRVVGTGPEMESLKCKVQSAKSKTVEFLGQVSDEELPKLYANAKATILASEDEDFGIVPVESMACGTPVIAPKAGGFLETVIDGKTGILYEADGHTFQRSSQVMSTDLIAGIKRFNEMKGKFSSEDCKRQAEKFSKEGFKKEILALVDKYLK